MRRLIAAALALGASLCVPSNVRAQRPAAVPAARRWMQATLPVEQRVRLLLAQMTLEEKFWQLYMTPGDPPRDSASFAHGAYGVQLLDLRGDSVHAPSTAAAAARADSVQRFFVERTRLGIPVILFEEGVHGLMQGGATVFPAAIGLAASFDTGVVGRVGAEIARQSRERGVRQLLSPVINLARDPRWGRVEETYGEDAWLSSAMGLAYVRALEQAGVVATPKHFVVNNGDGGRDSYPVSLDAATLEDLHFPPFRAAIDRGGARSVMASYNSVNGLPATASADLLTRTLRGQWKFGGVVIADQGGVGGARVLHHTAASYPEATARSLQAGLDVIFQSSAGDGGLFWPAFRDGLVPLGVTDTAVARVLRLKFALGLFEHPYVSVRAGELRAGELRTAESRADESRAGELRAAAAHDLALRAAEASVVLLRNERSTLPLRRGTARLAVIGVGSDAPLFGGYTVPPLHPRSLIRALDARLPAGDTVLHAPGPGLGDAAWVPVPATALQHDSASVHVAGVRGDYFANPSLEGPPSSSRTDGTVDFRWTFNRPARGLGTDWYSVRWSGSIEVAAAGGRLAVEGDDGYRLWVDDTLVIDADRKVSYGLRAMPAPLTPGQHALRLEYRQTTGTGRVRLLWNQQQQEESHIAEAVAIARRADVAVVTVGVDEGEFRDRSTLHLPGRQEELIERVAATGTPVVVVVFSGGAVIATPWLEKAGAVLQAFYPGEAGAEALARILFGDVSPAGRLPYTAPRADGQLPLVYDHLPTGRGDDYIDLTGQPLFPFGYGLSYTTFEYSDLRLPSGGASAGDTLRVRFTVTNSGGVASDEVPQLYVRHEGAPTAQPVLALRGFTRLSLRPGESRQVELALAVADLAVRDLDGARRVLPEDVILYVGASSRDIRLRGTVHLK